MTNTTSSSASSIDIDAARLGAFALARTVRRSFVAAGWKEGSDGGSYALEPARVTSKREMAFVSFLMDDRSDGASLTFRLTALTAAVEDACAVVVNMKSRQNAIQLSMRAGHPADILSNANAFLSHLNTPLDFEALNKLTAEIEAERETMPGKTSDPLRSRWPRK